MYLLVFFFFFSSRRRHTRSLRDWSSDVCSSDLIFGVNWGARLTAGPDGTSNTVMFNEVRIGLNANDRRGVWAMGLAGSSVTAASAIGDATGPNDGNEYSDDIEDCNALRQAQGVGNSGLGKL